MFQSSEKKKQILQRNKISKLSEIESIEPETMNKEHMMVLLLTITFQGHDVFPAFYSFSWHYLHKAQTQLLVNNSLHVWNNKSIELINSQ